MAAQRREAFTLVEMLLVMTIIAIMIAILVPSVPSIVGAYRANMSQVLMGQLSTGVDAYRRVYGDYPHDTVWWNGTRLEGEGPGYGDCEYLRSQGYESLYLALQGPDGAGWGPTAGDPGILQFGPVPISPGNVGRDADTGRRHFTDGFGRPVLYYKARPGSVHPDINADRPPLSTRYIYLVNQNLWRDQRGADELPFGPNKFGSIVPAKAVTAA